MTRNFQLRSAFDCERILFMSFSHYVKITDVASSFHVIMQLRQIGSERIQRLHIDNLSTCQIL
jgi:hypothetical protein